MCHFITALIPASAHLPAVEAVFDKHKVRFKPIENPSVLAQTAPGDIYVLTTRAWCDCGTPLGSLNVSKTLEDADESSLLNKLRKQGWSETKIQRRMEQKQQNSAKKERTEEVHAENAMTHVEPWVTFFADLLWSGHTPRVGLLLHWYKKRVETERFTILPQEYVPLKHLNAEQLLHISEDVIYNYIP